MEVLDGTEQIVDDMLRVLHFKVNVRLDYLLEITLGVLHDHVESVETCRVLRVK